MDHSAHRGPPDVPPLTAMISIQRLPGITGSGLSVIDARTRSNPDEPTDETSPSRCCPPWSAGTSRLDAVARPGCDVRHGAARRGVHDRRRHVVVDGRLDRDLDDAPTASPVPIDRGT